MPTDQFAPGDVIKYKRDGKFRVVEQAPDGRWVVMADPGKFAGKQRTVTLAADTVVVERAPRPEPTPTRVSRKRDPLPAGCVTPYQLAAIISERGLYNGRLQALPGRFVHSAAIRAGKDNPSPFRRDRRDDGTFGRLHCPLEEGLTWWLRRQRSRADSAA